jgi:XTP/dITP diphosphohydrolase
MPPGSRVVVATGNRHKVEEIRDALAFTGWEFVAAVEVGEWPEPEETGETFEDNARIKALAARALYGLPALADDSGLEVDALDGEPGVNSRYYAGPCANDAENNARLLLALGDTPRVRREARFRSVIVLMRVDGSEVVAEGACEGHIGTEPRGEHGFGYDPLFWPDATPGLTMAELAMGEKNAISHRGAALRAMHDLLEAEGDDTVMA